MGRKEETKEKLVKAVGSVLARDGFKGLGVNKVAKEAGVDKVLVYRYFKGLPGLIGEYSRTVDFWPTVEELIGSEREYLEGISPDMQVAFFFKSFLNALRKRPQTIDILAWELLERNELTKQLEDIRLKTILSFFDSLDRLPDDDTLKAVVVLMGGAVNHLLVKSRITDFIGGIRLDTEEGWEEIDRGIELLLSGIFKA